MIQVLNAYTDQPNQMGVFQMRPHALRGTLKDENTGYFQVS